jgi:hypothetical protein
MTYLFSFRLNLIKVTGGPQNNSETVDLLKSDASSNQFLPICDQTFNFTIKQTKNDL